MESSYPFYSFYYAAYGITALIYVGYAINLYRRGRALRDRAPHR